MFLTTVIILNTFLFNYGIVYDCSVNSTIYLNTSEIAFYETTGFPKYISSDDFVNNCLLNFSSLSVKKDQWMIIAYREFGYGSETNEAGQYYIFLFRHSSFYSLETNFLMDKMLNIAQTGYVIFENSKGCPMESISPFKFSDVTQMIYIQSRYENSSNRIHSCKWEFYSPGDNYGFKIFIKNFNLTTETQFIVKNSTDMMLNERSVIINHPYYNSDNYIQIYLSRANPNVTTINEFQAYITIIKKDVNVTSNTDCHHFTILSDTYWRSNGIQTYKSNSRCTFDLVIPPKIQTMVDIGSFGMEPYVDYINYYSSTYGNGTLNVPRAQFSFPQHQDISNRHVLWEFVSDGSIQSSGFDIRFSTFLCECADPIVECDKKKVHTIQNATAFDSLFSYCPNLNCNFTLKCDSELILLTIQPYSTGELNDIFRVFSNDILVFEVVNYNILQASFKIYLNSSNTNIFETITFPTPFFTMLTFIVSPFKVPPVDTSIILTPSNPESIILVEPNKLYTVEVSPLLASSKLILHSSINEINLYNNKSLSLKLANEECFSNLNLFECVLKTNSFTIYNADTDIYTYLSIRTSRKTDNCVFNKNLFVLSHAPDFFNIAVLSDTNGPCIVTIFRYLTLHFYISHIWRSSHTENVQVFAGTNQTDLLFEMNSKTSPELSDIILESYVYIIKVPKKASLFLTIKPLPMSRLFQVQYPYKSVVATPHYGIAKLMIMDTNTTFIGYEIEDDSIITFTATKYNMLKGDEFYFITDNSLTKLRINKSGDSISFQNQTVFLHYEVAQSSQIDNGAVFLVETNKNIKKKLLKRVLRKFF